MEMDKDMKKLIAEIERQSFVVRYRRSSHAYVTTPAGRYVTDLASTPSDRRGVRNAIAALRRAGFVWPP